jgi:hypothetical protein
MYETEVLFLHHVTFGNYSDLANIRSSTLSLVSPIIWDYTITEFYRPSEYMRPVLYSSQHSSCRQGLIGNEIFASRDKGVGTKYAHSLISAVLPSLFKP